MATYNETKEKPDQNSDYEQFASQARGDLPLDSEKAEGQTSTPQKCPGSDLGRLPCTVANRRRRPGEVVNLLTAVRNQCAECNGWEVDCMGQHTTLRQQVLACTAKDCWLYPWRYGENHIPSEQRGVFNTTQISTEPRMPEEYASKQISGRSFCAVCQGGGNKRETLEAVRQCPSVECWLWPFRNGGVPDRSDVAGRKEEK